MEKKCILSLFVSGILITSIVFTGCGNGGSTLSKNKEDKDQHITVAFTKNDLQTLDPSKSTDLASGYVIQECTESLAREEIKNGKDQYVPAGAKDWSVSQDGKTWTFHLRKNKWADGKDVTADQYVYSIKRTLAKDTASDYAYLLIGSGIKGASDYNEGKCGPDEVGVKALDDLTLQITLDHPCGYFTKLLSNKLFAPQREDFVNKYGDKYGQTAESIPCNGPFKLTFFQNGSKIELVKNNDYWDKNKVKLNKVTMMFLKDENARMDSLMNKQIDLCEVDKKEWIDKFSKLSNFFQIKSDYPQINYNVFNLKNKYFNNVKIRKAFSLVVDKNAYFKTVGGQVGRPSYGLVPYSVQIGNDEYRKKVPEELKGDKEDPKELLEEGLKEIGADEDTSKITINYLIPGTDQVNKDEADYMINVVKSKLGINIKCKFDEWAQYLNDSEKGDYDMCISDWIGDYNDPMTFFDMWETGADIEHNSWSDKNYDSLVEDAKNTSDQSRRLSDFEKAEKMLICDQAVIGTTYYGGRDVFTEKYVKGLESPLFSSGDELKYAYISGK